MAQTELVKLPLEIRHIIEAHEFDAGNKRRERLAIFRGIRNRKRAERAPVKRILERQECVVFFVRTALLPLRSRLRMRVCRASFKAPSIASVPLFVKNTRSRPDHCASFCASGP